MTYAGSCYDMTFMSAFLLVRLFSRREGLNPARLGQLCAHGFPTSLGSRLGKTLRPLGLVGFPLFGVTQLVEIPGPGKDCIDISY